jgi:hypothetical protein
MFALRNTSFRGGHARVMLDDRRQLVETAAKKRA